LGRANVGQGQDLLSEINAEDSELPFESPDKPLTELLEHVRVGKIRLPDFQREWKWDDERIRELLVSISLGHPVGVLMLLQVGGEDVRFAPKTLSGVDATNILAPTESLVLDGQQRLTSLFQALKFGKPVQTIDSRQKQIERWYYVDIRKAVDPDVDRDEAVISVPADRVIRTDFGRVVQADYSSREKECEAEVFPLSLALDMKAIFAWHKAYTATKPERSERWNTFFGSALENIVNYIVPVIVLTKETPKEAVCTVFEKVNTGGVQLNVFELLTATFASDDFRLKDDWETRRTRLRAHRVLQSIESTDFMQALTLLATRRRRLTWSGREDEGQKPPGISCKRRDILKLRLDEYRDWADSVTAALEWSAAFLAQEYVFRAEDLPYRSQLIPLSAIKVALGPKAETHAAATKLRQWYWCGVLGELYGGTTETRFARDLEQVPVWLDGGPVPGTVTDAFFQASRLLTLRSRNSAAYKGIYARLMRRGCRDWIKNETINLATFFDQQVDIHHVFPKAWCERHEIDDARRESIVNKTPLSRSTNISIGGRSPADYIATIESRSGLDSSGVDQLLNDHLVDPAYLRQADFNRYFSSRSQALLDLVSDAMGKPVVTDGDSEGAGTGAFIDGADELEEDLVEQEPPVGDRR